MIDKLTEKEIIQALPFLAKRGRCCGMNDIDLLEALELWHKQVTDARTNYLLLMGEEHEETALHEATLLAAIKFMHRTYSEIEALRMDNQQLQSDIANANMNADHTMAENARLRKIAGAMHTWIFLHTGDEEKAYQECGLTDEDNEMLGYIGKIELAEQEGDA